MPIAVIADSIVGKRKNSWQDIDTVLQYFGNGKYSAQKQYRDFVDKEVDCGRTPELTGGGLLRPMRRGVMCSYY